MNRSLLAKITLTALVACSAVSTDLYLSGLPAIAADFGTDAAGAQLTVSLFMLGFAVGQLFYGPLSDRFGRLPVLKTGLALYAATSVLCMVAGSIGMLQLARLLQGLAAAAGPVLARAIVNDRYAATEGARLMSYLAAGMALVPALAPIIGSWMLMLAGWRAQFLVLSLFGVVVLWGVFAALDETRPPEAAAAPGGLSAMLGLLRPGPYLGFVLCGSLVFGSMFSWISSASFIVIGHFGVTPGDFGYAFCAVALGYIGGSYTSARLARVVGPERTTAAGLAVACTASGALWLVTLSMPVGLGLFLLLQGLTFLGCGMSFANSQILALSRHRERSGSASAVFGLIQTATGALASALLAQVAGQEIGFPVAAIFGFAAAAAAVFAVTVAVARGTDSGRCPGAVQIDSSGVK